MGLQNIRKKPVVQFLVGRDASPTTLAGRRFGPVPGTRLRGGRAFSLLSNPTAVSSETSDPDRPTEPGRHLCVAGKRATADCATQPAFKPPWLTVHTAAPIRPPHNQLRRHCSVTDHLAAASNL